jgi:hypothetical protein
MSRRIAHLFAACALTPVIALAGGCLDRPVSPAEPHTSNVFVELIQQDAINKIDLLFVIDNSRSMADKQKFLAQAVPELVGRLIDPPPDPATNEPIFRAIEDIHIGVISSSLGGFGGFQCSPAMGPAFDSTMNDGARLIATVRGLPSYEELGFLAWDPSFKKSPAGEGDGADLIADFQGMVAATGELGCGYEATLESWYRFLIDPDPPAEVIREGNGSIARGRDEVLLAQRAAFVRPDSLIAIIMLTDENDCSMLDRDLGWVVAETGSLLPRATSACADDPNHACCRPCTVLEESPPSGCLPVDEDSGCKTKVWDAVGDDRNLRCWDQKRRFGLDLLQPIARYVDALTKPRIISRSGEEVENPLVSRRPPERVYLAGIVGVPWQDIATDESLSHPTRLSYLSAEEIAAQGRWDVILGDPQTGRLPTDPLMHESGDPRGGVHPITLSPLASPSTTDPTANPINGHEYFIPKRDDLQYACIFELPEERNCGTASTEISCDCKSENIEQNKPLCNPPEGGAATTTQYFAKAYPGPRHLEVLKEFGKNSIVASICPKVVNPDAVPGGAQDPSYGYNPAVEAILGRFTERLVNRCLPRRLTPDAVTGTVPCHVVEALPVELSGTGSCTPCDPALGRSALGAGETKLAAAVRTRMKELGHCGADSPSGVSCESLCMCRIEQFQGEALTSCQTNATATMPGYCYIDAEREVGDAALVAECPDTMRRALIFVGDDTPQPGSSAFIACSGATFSTNQ